jgi:hypothetical protein
VAVYTKETAQETLGNYISLHVSCNSFSGGCYTPQWSLFIFVLSSHNFCLKAGGTCANNFILFYFFSKARNCTHFGELLFLV